MVRRSCLVCLVWLVYEPAFASAQDGRLERVRNDVRSTESSSHDNDSSTDEDEGFLSSLVSAFLQGLIDGTAWSGSDETGAQSEPRFSHFVPYPYCGNFPGYRVPNANLTREYLPELDYGVEPLRWSARLSAENGNDFDGLNRANGRLMLETACGFGLLTSWNHFYERLDGGRHDDFVIGDFNAIYSWGWGSACTLRCGVGARVLADRGAGDWGVNIHLGGDFFPVRPLILSIDSDFGTLGDAGVAHGRMTLGVIHRGWEIFGGYDALAIGGTTLHGPLIGVRLWF
ncbi:MAG: hypothetical protein L0Y71_24465 [Gemmataceae bacterium]|nr:hypothetical protein [Gemmataceae bacterium]